MSSSIKNKKLNSNSSSNCFIPFQKKAIVQAISAFMLIAPLAVSAQEDAALMEEIQVTGIRGSLKAALDVKRNATSIVDAINSEDIGKFPDKNVADSLQRIPGVSVDRIWGEGRDIFVRGTNSTMNRTLMNGQNVASAYWWANDNASRGFNYSILASELVSGLEVFKSPEASHDEGSIGGMVNVKTRRPMDLDAFTVNASIEGQYSDLPDEWDPQFSALVSWKNDAETFAVLASFNSQERTVRRDGLEAFPTNSLYDVVDQNGTTTEDVYAVWGGGSAIFQQERERTTSNITLQFQPTDQWDIVANYVSSDMSMDNSNQNYLFVVGGTAAGNVITVDDPRFIDTADGNKAVLGGNFNVNGEAGAAIEPIFRDAYVESEVFDIDANYDGDNWRLHVQAGNTNAKGGSKEDVGYWFEAVSSTQLNLSGNSVEVSYGDIDPNDHSVMTMTSARDWIREMTDEETYAQADIDFDVNWSIFTSVETGLKYRDHTVDNNRTAGSANASNPNWQVITMDQVSGGLTPKLHGEAATSGSLTQYAWIDGDKAKSVIHPMFDAGAMVYTFDERAYFELNEKILAGYVQANFETGDLSGNFGVRVVETDQTSTAYINGALGDVGRTYTDTLPSLNMIYHMADDLIIRGAISRAMARPTFTDLSANIVINATSGVATAGNPELDPTYSDQFEVGAEWYFDDTSLVSATLFNKSLDTFVVSNTATEVIDGTPLSVTRPTNAPDGADLLGLELQWQQEIYNGFGMVTNYTWTDADAPKIGGQKYELPGNSEHQMNASFYYENDVFSTRLSYNYRSESYGSVISGSQQVTDNYDQWDLTMNYAATENIEIFATGVNLTNEIISIATKDGVPVGFYENGARYTLGARVKF